MASRTIPGRWLAVGVALFIALVAGGMTWLLLSRYQGHMFDGLFRH